MKNHSLNRYYGFNEWYIMPVGPQCIAAQQGFQKMMGMAVHLKKEVWDGLVGVPTQNIASLRVLRCRVLRCSDGCHDERGEGLKERCKILRRCGCSDAGCSDAPRVTPPGLEPGSKV